MQPGRLFGTSGIRGVADRHLTADFCHEVGSAIGTALPPYSRVCIATDTRSSREVIKQALVSGLTSSGMNVVDLGILPTPALALLTRELGFATGIMVTASHNPPEFNGIKLFNGNSLGYSREQEAEIERIYFDRNFRQTGKGTVEKASNSREKYLSFIESRLPAPAFDQEIKVVVDPGNGAASNFASYVLGQMGINVTPLNDTPDGTFPGRSPEPREDTLQSTIEFLRHQDADLAICFDGDADRVVFCDRAGFLGFNEAIAYISRLMVKRTGKRKIATTVETGYLLDLAVRDLGIEVVRGRVGDVPVAYLTRDLDAALGVEQVGVYIFPELGYYPDSIFASIILLAETGHPSKIRQFFRNLPRLFFQKAKVDCPDQLKEPVMTQLKARAHSFAPATVNTLDGVRLEFPHSWLLIRASGTEPVIRIISESNREREAIELIDKGKELVQHLVEASK